MEQLTWKQLEEVIQTLSEEQKNKPVVVLDFAGGVIVEVSKVIISDEKIYSTFDGIFFESELPEIFDPEEVEEMKVTSYSELGSNEPYLTV